MAEDRGGLRYTIEVVDEFSKETTRFREEVDKARQSFAELKKLQGRGGRAKATQEETTAQKALNREKQKQLSIEELANKRIIAARKARAVDLELSRRGADLSRRSAAEVSKEAEARRKLADEIRRAQVELRKLRQTEGQRRELETLNDELFIRRKVATALRKQRVEARLLAAQKKLGVDLGIRENRALTAEEEARKRVARATRDQQIAQAEVGIRRSQGLPVSPALLARAKGQVESLNKQVGFLQRNLNGIVPSLRRIVAAFLLFTAARAALQTFRSLLTTALQFNSALEKAEISIAGLVTAAGSLTTVFGTADGAANGFEQALAIAREQTVNLRRDALRTAATFVDLLDAFQVSIAPGLTAGLDVEQIRQVTVLISQAATSLGVAQNQLAEEIRSVLTGAINVRTSRIATALGITNEDVNRAREFGDLFEFLQGRLDAFDRSAARVAQSFSGLTARIKDALQVLLGEAGQGFFIETRGVLQDILGLLLDGSDPNQTFIAALEPIFAALTRRLQSFRQALQTVEFDEIAERVRVLSRALDNLLGIGAALAEGFAQGLGDLASIFGDIENQSEFLESIARNFSRIATVVITIGTAAAAIAFPFQIVLGLGKSLVGVFSSLANRVSVLVARAGGWTPILIAAEALVKRIGVAVLAVATGPIGIFVASVTGIALVLREIVSRVAQVRLALLETATVVGTVLLQAITGIGIGISKLVLGPVRAAVTAFRALLRAASDFSGVSFFDGAIDDLNRVVRQIDGLSETIEDRGNAFIQQQIANRERILEDARRDAVVSAEAITKAGERQVKALSDILLGVRPALSAVSETLNSIAEDSQKTTAELKKLELESKALELGANQENLELRTSAVQTQIQLEQQLKTLQSARLRAEARLLEAESRRQLLSRSEFNLIERSIGILERRQQALDDIRDIEREIQDLNLESGRALRENNLARQQELEARRFTLQASLEEAQSREAVAALLVKSLKLDESQASILQEIVQERTVLKGLAADEKELLEGSKILLEALASLEASRAAAAARQGAADLDLRLASLRREVDLQRELNRDGLASGQQRVLALRGEQNERLAVSQSLQDQLVNSIALTREQLKSVEAGSEAAQQLEAQLGRLREQLTLSAQLTQIEQLALQRQIEATEQLLDLEQRRFNLQAVNSARRETGLLQARVDQERALLRVVGDTAAAEAQRFQIQQQFAQARNEATLQQRRDALALLEIEGNRALLEGDPARANALAQHFIELQKQLRLEEELLALQTQRAQQEQATASFRNSAARLQREEELALLRAQVNDQIRLQATQASTDAQATARARNAVEQARVRNSFLQQRLALERQVLQVQIAQAANARNFDVVGELSAQLLQLEAQAATYQRLAELQEQALNLELRRAQIYESGTLTDGLLLGIDQFIRQYESLARAGERIVTSALQTFTGSIRTAINQIAEGEDVGDALEQLAANVVNGIFDSLIEELLNKVTADILDSLFGENVDDLLGAQTSAAIMQASAVQVATTIQAGATSAGATLVASASQAAAILGFAGSPVPVAGKAKGGLVQGFDGGGKVKNTPLPHSMLPSGLDKRDRIPAMLRKDEYVVTPEGWKPFGRKFMDALNNGSLNPRLVTSLMRNAKPSRHRPKLGYAEGGPVLPGAASSSSVGSQGFSSSRTSSNSPDILPVISERQIEDILSGRNGVLRRAVKKDRQGLQQILRT